MPERGPGRWPARTLTSSPRTCSRSPPAATCASGSRTTSGGTARARARHQRDARRARRAPRRSARASDRDAARGARQARPSAGLTHGLPRTRARDRHADPRGDLPAAGDRVARDRGHRPRRVRDGRWSDGKTLAARTGWSVTATNSWPPRGSACQRLADVPEAHEYTAAGLRAGGPHRGARPRRGGGAGAARAWPRSCSTPRMPPRAPPAARTPCASRRRP